MELLKDVALERAELIARLCLETNTTNNDNQIALSLIAEIAKGVMDQLCNKSNEV